MVWEYPHKHVSLMPNIDSHQHFWQYHPVQHDWINDEMAIIRKDFLPSDLRTVLQENNMDGCVAVQADQTETETDFLVGLTKENDFIKGIVGWVNLRADEIRERLVHYKQFDSIKGFRHILQGEEPSFMLQADFMRGIAALKEFGFTYDILVFPKHLTAATALVKKNPDQLFVIDHIAKPDIKNGQIDKWKKDIQTIAQFENLYCKISGMVTEADYRYWKKEDFIPYIDLVVESFGTNRIMFGSDWPVCNVAAAYPQVLDIVRTYFSSFTRNEQDLFFGGNAVKFYKL